MKYFGRVAFLAFAFLSAVAPAAAQLQYASPNWRTSQVAVGTSATQVAPNTPTRRLIMITTTGTAQVYCGPTNSVSSTTGQPIAPVANSAISLQTTAAVWCIAASAQTVAVTETF